MANLNKEWMQCSNRLSDTYRQGVTEFLDYAYKYIQSDEKISCPCVRCNNVYLKMRDDVEADLVIYGIAPSYTRWALHGEDVYNEENSEDEVDRDGSDESDDFEGMVHDGCGAPNFSIDHRGSSEFPNNTSMEDNHDERSTLHRLMHQLNSNLYPGCDGYSKLSFLVRLWHLKCINRLSNTAFESLLHLFKSALPEGETLPNSFYEARKIIRDLGLDYEKIHACVNDCMIFWKENASKDACEICGANRWKKKKVPMKVIRYFPLIPRLQRLYMSKKTASLMIWHHDSRLDDGGMRHPADTLAWKELDRLYPQFASDKRNVRLGLACDGFNPFGNMSNSYSMWPIVLVPFNLPPWLCMKQESFILSTLVPGPKAPGNDIDVYLQPLVEELQILWSNGVETYDALAKQKFQLHGAILWTINDFPAYANMSAWSTKGKLACPCCHKDTCYQRLKHGSKFCYMGHRRFLPPDHKWRKAKAPFNMEQELRLAPTQLSGEDIVEQTEELADVPFGKKSKKRKQNVDAGCHNWRKRSIFFRLPYWGKLLIRHNLDVMHIEKNICDNIVGTLLNLEGKSKDNLNSRRDLEEMGIRHELHPTLTADGKWSFAPASYTLNLAGKQAFCKYLKDARLPDGFCSNISRCVYENEGKIIGLKSHDCHVLIQHLLPIAIRGRLEKKLVEALTELAIFFKELTSKTLWGHELEKLQDYLAITMCKLEMLFPPSFFDIMVHLPIHLAMEAKIAGPVQYRWMYPIERYLRTLKSYVRNKGHPEGSIAEAYIADECLTFCSRYLKKHGTTTPNRRMNHFDLPNPSFEVLSVFAERSNLNHYDNDSKVKGTRLLSRDELSKAHLYVIKNCDEVLPFLQEYEEIGRSAGFGSSWNTCSFDFCEWFQEIATKLYSEKNDRVSEHLYGLACGPQQVVTVYDAHTVNGFKFRTQERDKDKLTQNSGVFVKGIAGSMDMEYYGILRNIIGLRYVGRQEIMLFECTWWDVYNEGRGYEKDMFGYLSLNPKRQLATDEPYILAKQAHQAVFLPDNVNKGWVIALKSEPRDYYDVDNGPEESEFNPPTSHEYGESSGVAN